MAIQQVSVSKYEDPLFFGDSVTVPRPADMQNDDFVVIWVGGFEEGMAYRPIQSWTLPAGFSVAQGQSTATNRPTTAVMAVKWIEDISSEPADYTFTVGNYNWSLTAIAIAYRGLNETTPFSCDTFTIIDRSETINFPDGQPATDNDIYLAFYTRNRNNSVSWNPRLDENPEIERATTGCDTSATSCARTAAASFVTGTTALITGQTATHSDRRYQTGSIVLHAAAGLPGITITDIKEPNEADTPVDGVTNARVKVWFGSDDTAEDELRLNQTITNGTLTITGIEDEPLGDPVIVEVMWTVGTERKLFITETNLVDLEAGT